VTARFSAFASNVRKCGNHRNYRCDIFVAHANTAVGAPQATVRAGVSAMDADVPPAISFGDGCFARDRLEHDDSGAAKLADLKLRTSSSGDDARHPVSAYRRVPVRQRL